MKSVNNLLDDYRDLTYFSEAVIVTVAKPVNLFRVLTDSVLPLLMPGILGFTHCLLGYNISGRATCRLGSGGH
jgi:hypothetical protein